MSPIIAFLFAFVKAVPAAEQILQQLMGVYVAWKKEQNLKDEKSKDARDDADIDAARVSLPKLCAECPFAGNGAGQHTPAQAAPPVQGGGTSGP